MIDFKRLPVDANLGVEPVKRAMEMVKELGFTPNILLTSVAESQRARIVTAYLPALSLWHPTDWPVDAWCVGQSGKADSFIGSPGV